MKLAEKIQAEINRKEQLSYAEQVLSLYGKQILEPEAKQPPDILLTERESQVLVLLAQGLTQREIAEALFLSVSSIKKHLASIYTKLCVDNKIRAVQKAREANII